MQKIRAAVCHAFNEPLVIEEVNLAPPGPGEVEITLDAVAICHSDISYAEGAWGGTLPAVYGHEAAGRISATGEGVTGYKPGDSVIATLIQSCGTCPACATGHPVRCETPRDNDNGPLSMGDGSTLARGLNCGAFAEKMVVKTSQIAPYPAEIPASSACLLSCGVITGIGAVVNTGGVRAGETVVVIGAGGVGLNAIQGARIAGAGRIIAVDMSQEKLDAARDFGATDGILATDPKPWSAARKITGRGADAVFVTVGAIPAYDTAARYLAPGGRLVAVGMPHSGAKSNYEPVILAATGQQMVGSLMGDTVLVRDIRWMVDLYQQGRLKLDELVSNRFTLDQINEAFESTKSGTARRNVITF
ncbi:Zn-dependent alcohol dehydrogenase [Acidimangrovimonas pyrenivorans]|uniref:Zn-dependent alcohol dehydrogenase n=1 Tax=Acidimangrovimonas pyrenivorans TaxID=2030798 RepID=A0ABV7AL23_9RHOB